MAAASPTCIFFFDQADCAEDFQRVDAAQLKQQGRSSS